MASIVSEVSSLTGLEKIKDSPVLQQNVVVMYLWAIDKIKTLEDLRNLFVLLEGDLSGFEDPKYGCHPINSEDSDHLEELIEGIPEMKRYFNQAVRFNIKARAKHAGKSIKQLLDTKVL